MGKLTNSLKDAVKRLAFSTSVDQLKKRGVRQVNVLGLDRIAGLIEEAVRRSLKRKLLSVDSAEVADETKQEFLRLLRSNADLKKSHDQLRERSDQLQEESQQLRERSAQLRQQSERAAREADALRLQLQQAKQELATRLETGVVEQQVRFEEDNAEISDQLESMFEQFDPATDLGTVRGHVYELLMHAVQKERRIAVEAVEAARDRDVDTLQRRIQKLTHSLEKTEAQLIEVASAEPVETGIASRYREVQGLSTSVANFEKKKELMADIFKANMLLQKGVG